MKKQFIDPFVCNYKICQILGFVLLLCAFSTSAQLGIPNPIDPCILNPNLCGPELDPCILNPDLCEPEAVEPLPDLKIEGISTVILGTDGCVLEILVKNFGSGAVVSSFDVDVFFDLSAAPAIGDLSDHYVTHTVSSASPIRPGDVVMVRVPIPASVSGMTLNVSALVDSTRTVDESNEGNNHWFHCSSLYLGCLI